MDYLAPGLLLGLSLAMDCFAIALSQGLKPNPKPAFLIRLAILFGVFQGGMLLIGHLGGAWITGWLGPYADWLAAGMLGGIGIKMLLEGIGSEEEADESIELSGMRDSLVLSIATSIDALAAGLSLGSLKIPVIFATLCVGITSLLLGLLGGFSGKQLGGLLGKKAEIFGGLVLIGLGIKVLVF